MWCPQCGTDTRVLETDKQGETVSRIRWCRNGGCRFLFETHEVMLAQPPAGCAAKDGKPDRPVTGGTGARLSGKNNTAPKA